MTILFSLPFVIGAELCYLPASLFSLLLVAGRPCSVFIPDPCSPSGCFGF
jgi:hypothetical protein